jgi:hypothetical protein
MSTRTRLKALLLVVVLVLVLALPDPAMAQQGGDDEEGRDRRACRGRGRRACEIPEVPVAAALPLAAAATGLGYYLVKRYRTRGATDASNVGLG